MSFKTDFSETLPGDAKAPPARLGNYEIMGVLGQGQSATIYLGRELFPAREVAIKVYDPHQFGDDTKLFRSLFLKETLLAKKLTHPGITQIYDAAADDERAYIVMEYMEGGCLDSYCTPQTLLPPVRVAHILERVCDALSYAHAHGIVHRDLKPQNILMGADGEAKVADFGVAFTNLAFDSTRNMRVGSPAYMAPEQIEGKAATLKSDVYALGIMMYKMLVGALPFPADTPASLTARIMLGNLSPPSSARPGLPPVFDAIFRRATARDVALRYNTHEELASDLRTVTQPGGDAGDMAERVSMLRPLPFFRDFDEATLTETSSMARCFTVRAGTQLVGEKDPGYSFFIIVRGQMRLTRRGTLLAIRGAGESVAEVSFLRRSGQRFTTATAVTDCTVVEFDPDVLWLASPECTRNFHQAFLRTLADRLVAAEGALSELLGAKNVTLF
ncbi:MAG TPA: serine/threonine-protein kinase [Usitatibacter sp.]|nr:serine/threonine-protein kinase [Usitatibacter sp.]